MLTTMQHGLQGQHVFKSDVLQAYQYQKNTVNKYGKNTVRNAEATR